MQASDKCKERLSDTVCLMTQTLCSRTMEPKECSDAAEYFDSYSDLDVSVAWSTYFERCA
jgi:hypothetical protein